MTLLVNYLVGSKIHNVWIVIQKPQRDRLRYRYRAVINSFLYGLLPGLADAILACYVLKATQSALTLLLTAQQYYHPTSFIQSHHRFYLKYVTNLCGPWFMYYRYKAIIVILYLKKL